MRWEAEQQPPLSQSPAQLFIWGSVDAALTSFQFISTKNGEVNKPVLFVDRFPILP